MLESGSERNRAVFSVSNRQWYTPRDQNQASNQHYAPLTPPLSLTEIQSWVLDDATGHVPNAWFLNKGHDATTPTRPRFRGSPHGTEKGSRSIGGGRNIRVSVRMLRSAFVHALKNRTNGRLWRRYCRMVRRLSCSWLANLDRR